MINSRCAFTGLLIATLVPRVAGAQTIVESFDDLRSFLKPNEMVVVTDETGERTKGRIANLSDSSVTLAVKTTKRNPQGTQTFSDKMVTEIKTVDSLAEGTLIGLGAGVAATWGFVRYNCGPSGFDPECAANVAAIGTLIFVPSGAILGALTDKAIVRGFVYHARSSGAQSLTVSPWIGGRSSGGVAVSMAF